MEATTVMVREIHVFGDYCGIEFSRYYMGNRYCPDDWDTGEMSDTIFCLRDVDYTIENIKKQIESRIEEIFDTNYNGADDSYFYLYIPQRNSYRLRRVNVKEVLIMTGGESYYNEIYERYNKKMFREQYLYGMTLENLGSMIEYCCEDHKGFIQEYYDELKATND
jgi:hypothetical protein